MTTATRSLTGCCISLGVSLADIFPLDILLVGVTESVMEVTT